MPFVPGTVISYLIADELGHAMALRQLPSVGSLTDQQLRGWSCVWCGTGLTVGTGISLGDRRHRPERGAAYWWFPRACAEAAECARRECRSADPGYRALLDHTLNCTTCQTGGRCRSASELRLAWQEARQ